MRFVSIRHYAKGHCRYSNFFKAKVAISSLMGLFDLLQAIVILAVPENTQHSGWVNQCGLDWLAAFYLFQALAWFYGSWLMTFEYRRLLSEAWYSN
jgi:hypothetical protein